MGVRHEIKSQLAKLLATEDLVVEHKNVRTASFNVHTRVLTLPTWEKASNCVYDLLVGHEVGHALFTPDEQWNKTKNIPPSFVNIVEDARIEKLMKRKYGGLSKTFYRGYSELSDEDFFEVEDEDLSGMNLADRANLYFKIGNYVDIPFQSDSEKEIINMISDCETFADVLITAEELYKYCKDSQESHPNIAPPQQQSDGPTGGDLEEKKEWPTESDPEDDHRNDRDFNKDDADLETPSYEKQETDSAEPEVRTESSLEKNLQDLMRNDEFYENNYVEIQTLDMDKIVVDHTEIHSYLNQQFATQVQIAEDRAAQYEYRYANIFESADAEYKKFKKSAQKEVNYLVKEFECKKSADSYARATTARTGVLDCTKLHTYKYNEDLFKKVTTLADGKNHGLIFVLDWSGSMADVLTDTIKQLFNLVWFCKKVNIPFEVYAFTNHWAHATYDDDGKFISGPEIKYELKEDIFKIDKDFNLLNMLSSRIKSSDFEKCMTNVWRIATYYQRSGVSYHNPTQTSLSGTPLNEAIISLHQIIPQFQKTNKLQKVQCVILTDGEAHQLSRHVEVNYRYNSESYIGTRSVNPETTFLRDRKIGTTYSFGYSYHEFTQVLLNNLRDRFPNVNFIGIRVLGPREAGKFMQMYLYGDKFDEAEKSWKKTRSFSMKEVGYNTYFGLSANALSQETEFSVNTDATKAQIKSAFTKSLRSKKMNKKILSEFISLVC